MHEQSLHGAARLSEDIGDVLSSIRRMIAEDDALIEARAERRHTRRQMSETAPQAQMPERDDGEFLALRHGGNAALARRMVAAAPVSLQEDDAEDDRDITLTRDAMPEMRGLRAAARTAVPAAPVLRLGAAQRVIPGRDAAQTAPQVQSPWKMWSPPPAPTPAIDTADLGAAPSDLAETPPHLTPTALAETLARLGAAETVTAPPAFDDRWQDDDEPFEAKARMRPDLPQQTDQVLTGEPGGNPAAAWESCDQVLPNAPAGFDVLYDELTQQEDTMAADHPEGPAQTIATAVESGEISDDDQAEQIIRDTIREMIQEEMHGELGLRFSRNLRAMIRREVAAAIEENLDRF